ncbi:MAG: hypothetical protein AB1421_09905 [Pseudomonadota bacterium]
MEAAHYLHLTPGGATLTNCDLDANCAPLDCDAVMEEFGAMLKKSDDGRDFLAHYCGYQYMEKLQAAGESEE